MANEDVPRSEPLELYSGKVPLRPIQRIGLLLLNGVPLLAIVFFMLPMAISGLRGAPTAALFLIPPLILLWALIALACGRFVWAALTAPSQKEE